MLVRMTTQGAATFGEALRAALQTSGITQAYLARQLDIDAGQVSRWINDKALPHQAVVQRMNRILGTDLSQFYAVNVFQYQLYVASPADGLALNAIDSHQKAVQEVVSVAEEQVTSLFWSTKDLAAPPYASDLITERNLDVLVRCNGFLYLQFEETVRPSSALIELGIALGRRLKTTIIAGSTITLPYMLDGFAGVAATISYLPRTRIYRVDSPQDACSLLKNNGRELLGLS